MLGNFFYSIFFKIKQKEKTNKNEAEKPKNLLSQNFNIEDLEKCSEDNLKTLENHLESNSYLIGYEPSILDKESYKSLKSRKFANWETFPNLHRWFLHIESFSVDEQNAFTVEYYLLKF